MTDPNKAEANGEEQVDERTLRIIDAAIELADEGGFEGVRLRDVASRSGVALGTLYARFSSKEDILATVLEVETVKFELLLNEHPVEGDDALARLTLLFGMLSKLMFERDNFTRAVLRAVASGVPGPADKILSYRERVTRIVVAAMHGPSVHRSPSAEEEQVAFLLQQIWFAEMVGWMGGVEDEETVIEHTISAARLLLAGAQHLSTSHGR
ncbi:MAG: TetR/AcrR family transcriptional regulator [Myxococcota bacterium]